MGKKTKPRWTWNGVGKLPDELIDEKGSNLLASLFEPEKLSSEFKSELIEIAKSYHMNKNYFSSKPRLGEIRAGLEVVRDKAHDLITCLEYLDRDTYDKLAAASPNSELFGILDGQTDVDRIYFAAKKALETNKPDAGGHPRDYGLKDCIIALAIFFEKITGKKAGLTKSKYNERSPFQGSFFAFVQSFLKIIDKSILHSNVALGKQIEKTLKLRKKSLQ